MRPSRTSSTPFPLQQLVGGSTVADVRLSYAKESRALLDHVIMQLANPGDSVVAVSLLPQNGKCSCSFLITKLGFGYSSQSLPVAPMDP